MPLVSPLTILASSGPGPLVYGPASNATWFDLVKPIVLPAGTIEPGSTLELDAIFEFQGSNAGRSIQVTVNGVSVAQAFPAAPILAENAKVLLYVAGDGKSILTYSPNINDVLSPTAGQGAPFAAKASAPSTLVIDTSGETTIRVQGKPLNGDLYRITGLCLTQRASKNGAGNLLPSNAISCWGDSLTAGSGSVTPTGGWPSQLRQALTGRGVTNLGIGGQTSKQIIDRLVADKNMGSNGIIVSWIGRNDVGVVTDLWETVRYQHSRAYARLAPGAVYLPCTITPASTETAGSAIHNSILAANAAIRRDYPRTFVDTFAALATQPDGTIPSAWRSDSVHLNDAGYTVVKNAVQAKLTELGL